MSEEDFYTQLSFGRILYFSCPELNTSIPHFFIIFATQEDGIKLLSCATSRADTMQTLVDRKRFSEKTIVFIKPNGPFHLDTYINCNEYFPYQPYELWDLFRCGTLTMHGELDKEYSIQMLIGLKSSDVIEEETKDILPDPDTI